MPIFRSLHSIPPQKREVFFVQLTLELTAEEVGYLKELQADFAHQKAHDQAEYPNVYVLVDFQAVAVDPDYETGGVLHFSDPSTDNYAMTLADLPDYFDSCHPQGIAAFLDAHSDFNWESESDVELLVEEFPDIDTFHNALRQVDVQTFLTRQSAESHLAANRHHYHDQAFIDRRKVWRDPGMKSLLLMLYGATLPQDKNAAQPQALLRSVSVPSDSTLLNLRTGDFVDVLAGHLYQVTAVRRDPDGFAVAWQRVHRKTLMPIHRDSCKPSLKPQELAYYRCLNTRSGEDGTMVYQIQRDYPPITPEML